MLPTLALPEVALVVMMMMAPTHPISTPTSFFQVIGSFRIKNLQLGYSFPEEMLSKIRFKGLQVYLTCENPFVFSNMKGGWDPEYNADGSGRAYPVARVYSVGLNVKF